MRIDEADALRSVGLYHAQGTCGFSLNCFQCDQQAFAAATREQYDDISWTFTAGHDDRSHVEDAYEADADSNVSEDWHHGAEFEELDPNTIVLEYVREGQFSIFVTTCKKGPDWTPVFQIIADDVDIDEVLEDRYVYKHEAPFYWRKRPKQKHAYSNNLLLRW